MCNRLAPALAILSLFGQFSTSSADEFRLEGATLPAPIVEAGKPNVIIEASGAEPIGDGPAGRRPRASRSSR